LQWGAAECIYRSIIKSNPKHADALHMLGALLVQMHGEKEVSHHLIWSPNILARLMRDPVEIHHYQISDNDPLFSLAFTS
jgi:hypothetical protein